VGGERDLVKKKGHARGDQTELFQEHKGAALRRNNPIRMPKDSYLKQKYEEGKVVKRKKKPALKKNTRDRKRGRKRRLLEFREKERRRSVGKTHK